MGLTIVSRGNNLNLHLLIIYKLVHSPTCLFYYLPGSLIRIVHKALECLKENTKTQKHMENRRKMQ